MTQSEYNYRLLIRNLKSGKRVKFAPHWSDYMKETVVKKAQKNLEAGHNPEENQKIIDMYYNR